MSSITIYDSSEVRRSARQVRSSLEAIQTSAQPPIRDLRKSLDANMQGDAAKALDRRLERLEADLKRYADCLSSLNHTLNRFADSIDAADARLKAIMK